MAVSLPKVDVKTIAFEDIEPNPAQPPHRCQDGPALQRLVEDIRAFGLTDPPYVACIKGQYIAINGHRRIAALKLLNKDRTPCRVINGCTSLEDATNRFAALDGVTRRLKSADTFYGWRFAPNRKSYLDAIPRKTAGTIRAFVEITGVPAAEKYAEQMTDPSVVWRARTVTTFLAAAGKTPPKTSTVLAWIVKHKASVTVQTVMKTGNSRQISRLLCCIEEDRAFRFKRPE